MNRFGFLLASVCLALVLAVGVAVAAEITGTAGNDTLTGTAAGDVIKGAGGNDTISGLGGDDNLYGGAGTDQLRGDAGADTLTGNDGDDHLYDRSGNTAEVDSFYCGVGQDTVEADATDTINSSCETVDTGGGGAGEAQELPPDLGMARIAPIYVCPSSNTATACSATKLANQQLRFTAKIVNVGPGNFEARGSLDPTKPTPTMNVEQRIYDSAGGSRDVRTAAEMYYSAAKPAGDGHNHWHLKNLETYTLTRLDGSVERGGNKQGFCFYDNINWGSSQPAFYTQSATKTGLSNNNSCARQQPGAQAVMMGLSRGWGDNYSWNTVGQSITIAGLPDGDYRLTATADEAGLFEESDESNNSTYVNIRLRGIGTTSATVTVLAYGPSSPPV